LKSPKLSLVPRQAEKRRRRGRLPGAESTAGSVRRLCADGAHLAKQRRSGRRPVGKDSDHLALGRALARGALSRSATETIMRKRHIAAVLLLALIGSIEACSRAGQRETSTLTGPTSPTTLGRRVEDPGGITPSPTPCPLPGDCLFTLSLTTAGGDVLSGTCNILQANCPLTGTGRFTDAVLRQSSSTFELIGSQLSVTLVLKLPSLGEQAFQISGVLDATVQTQPDSGCQSGARRVLGLSGVLEQLGPVSGTYSACVPPSV
jgi:hypothetical protein